MSTSARAVKDAVLEQLQNAFEVSELCEAINAEKFQKELLVETAPEESETERDVL